MTFASTHQFLPTLNIHKEIQHDRHLDYCITGRILTSALNRPTMVYFLYFKRSPPFAKCWSIMRHGLPLVQVTTPTGISITIKFNDNFSSSSSDPLFQQPVLTSPAAPGGKFAMST